MSNIRSAKLTKRICSQPYLDSDMQSRWFDFGGDTIVRTDSYIRLTSDLPSQSGWLFSRVPLTATNWEVEVEFKISGKHQLYGDGFAMWITKQRGQMGPVFGSVDRFEGLGIFVDTYKNNRPGVVFPYVMAIDNHDIISVSTKNLYNSPGSTTDRVGANKGRPIQSNVVKEGSSWTWFFTKIILFFVAVGGVYVGYTAYRAKSKSHRF
ncbi:L-type lectin-like domain-containing protein [Metarhizium anisopliae]